MSAEDWNRDEQRKRHHRCDTYEGGVGHHPGERCGRTATWSTDDVPGVTWMCDECCREILSRTDGVEVTEVDP